MEEIKQFRVDDTDPKRIRRITLIIVFLVISAVVLGCIFEPESRFNFICFSIPVGLVIWGIYLVVIGGNKAIIESSSNGIRYFHPCFRERSIPWEEVKKIKCEKQQIELGKTLIQVWIVGRKKKIVVHDKMVDYKAMVEELDKKIRVYEIEVINRELVFEVENGVEKNK